MPGNASVSVFRPLPGGSGVADDEELEFFSYGVMVFPGDLWAFLPPSVEDTLLALRSVKHYDWVQLFLGAVFITLMGCLTFWAATAVGSEKERSAASFGIIAYCAAAFAVTVCLSVFQFIHFTVKNVHDAAREKSG